ncbi:MAG: group 1 truncated hemoglobin [Alphaproteobacteria bacterium]
MSEQRTLFERIGGTEAVKAAVAKLYEKVLTDPLLAPFFADIDVDKLRRSQSAFVTVAFGGQNNYNGASMRVAHKKLVERGLSDQHFDAVAEHLRTALQELSVTDGMIAEALAIVETTRQDVLNR